MRKCYQFAAQFDDYSYFHCIANATRKHHQSDRVSFDDRDKDYLLGLLKRLEKLYAGIEVLQYCVMGTHVHIVLAANNKLKISRKEVKELYEEYHRGNHEMDARSEFCYRYRLRLNDVSQFMRDFQWTSATHFNSIRRIAGKHRFGSIWNPKFNCGQLEGGKAVRQCSLYVAMNPVRANLVLKAETYKWSSWGERKMSGKHPHQRALKKYFSRNKFDERNYTDMIAMFGEKIESLEAAHAKKREDRKYKYSKHERKYLNENPIWHEKKFIGDKEFCKKMRGLGSNSTGSNTAAEACGQSPGLSPPLT
jgi:REP element-mobilizing transposase RayT